MNAVMIQISREEFDFYISNRVRLAELEKSLAVTHGEIHGALMAERAGAVPAHHAAVKSMLHEGWLHNVLGSLGRILAGGGHSPRLVKLNALVTDTLHFVGASYPRDGLFFSAAAAEELIGRLKTISNAIGEIRLLAEVELIARSGGQPQ